MKHQIIIHRNALVGTGWDIVARCGATTNRGTREPLPEAFTVWPSRVTCPECLFR